MPSINNWRSIVTLILFVLANVIVIFPFYVDIPVPHLVARTLPRSPSDSWVSRRRARFKFDFVTAPILIVLLLWAMTAIDSTVVRDGIVGTNGIQPLSTMALFISLAYLTVSLDKIGLYAFLAVWVARRGKSSGRRLFFFLYLFFLACAVLFGNDPVVLSGTPFLAHFIKYAGIESPTPWIFSQLIAANTASAILPPSNLTNLVVTSAFSLSFLSYAAHTVVPVILVAASLFVLLRFIQFRSTNQIPRTFNVAALQTTRNTSQNSDPEINNTSDAEAEELQFGKLLDPAGAIFGSSLFIATLLVLLGTSVKKIPVWWITVPAAAIMIVRDVSHDLRGWKPRYQAMREGRGAVELAEVLECKLLDPNCCPDPTPEQQQVLQRQPITYFKRAFRAIFPHFSKVLAGLPIAMLPFSFSMFILVHALTATGWIEVFSKWWAAWVRVCGPDESLRAVAGAIFGMQIISVLLCNFCGTNIGATVFLSQIIADWISDSNAKGQPVGSRLQLGSIYALALGTNFGAYSLTISASLAGLLWKNILKGNNVNKIDVRLRDFALLNAPSTLVAIAVSAIALFVEVIVIKKN
ncbi:hypothetical protein SCHPADRAFT_996099 [Schizopora paradoxa]|uniref:Citrate transporter-like domain-containing protein n=1 Tax=Schizopora paradoxa TaxID=27342 RepID=A0A0H2S055_9AGAM|nr:hypothetical protein SCHPADRAFT_996099 [Schizopora paradoxa]